MSVMKTEKKLINQTLTIDGEISTPILYVKDMF